MQRITITGYLSRDAEASSTRDGTAVTRWNVPVKQGWGDSEQTNWFRVSIWGKRSEFAAKASKGDFVTVTGELTIGEYEGKPQYEIRADDFHAVRSEPRDNNAPPRQRSAEADRRQSGRAGGTADGWGKDDGEDIPFLTRNSIW